MMKKLTGFLLTLVLALGLLSGCGAPSAQPSLSPGEGDGSWIGPSETTPAPGETEASAYPMTVTDQAGREVTVNARPAKIVSGYYISTSACIALGLKDAMVGIEKKIIPIYKLAAPSFLELPNVGTAKEFDLEGCLALKPELVILPKKLKDAAETISQQGIPVLLVNPENQEQLVEMLTLIGKVTGTAETADKLVKTYADSTAKLQAINDKLTDADKPVVYLGGNGAFLTTAPKDMYQATLIRLGGGVNAGDSLDGDSWTEVSYEQVLAMNPDVIILPSDASY
ncbi:MAG: ABC transporter substrate-binding protein, partial [Clostridia bacterium]|nr:ABC transporter substrate-binding protein [Clostridia bacterium]